MFLTDNTLPDYLRNEPNYMLLQGVMVVWVK